ncbi:MAG: LysR family transcriptional regulator [Nannocystaceae bacterium]|nr:LysR family transcriptional regulator [Nannocystaceae bacterium]
MLGMVNMTDIAGLDLNLLTALDVLLAERSVTVAADRLGVTQSAMSHKLRRLRAQLNDPLFVAGRDGFVPMQRAEAMAVPLREALHNLHNAVCGQPSFDPATAKRRFVLAAPDYFEFVLLPTMLSVLRDEAPGIELSVAPRRGDVSERMQRGEVDVVFGPVIAEHAGIRRTKLATEGFLVMARKGHPLFKKKLTLERYLAASHILISPGGQPGGQVDAALAKTGRRRHVAVQVASFSAAPLLAAQSELLLTGPTGLAIAARRYVELEVADVPVKLEKLPSFMGWHARFDADPGHQWLRLLAKRFSRAAELARER